ncbi:MAG: preprotein translocase subunit SecG [Desulfuromonas sp.]|nr:MAG: preprotein translocase subunit SecG [Desulfuromonas sp.]
MSTLLVILHVTVSIALIVIVLLQMGKGAEAGASFGAGASNTMMGTRSGGSFMGKVTAAAAVIFMLTSLTLAYFYSSPASKTVMPSSVNVPVSQVPEGFNPGAPAEPAQPAAAPAPAEPTAAPEDAEKK